MGVGEKSEIESKNIIPIMLPFANNRLYTNPVGNDQGHINKGRGRESHFYFAIFKK